MSIIHKALKKAEESNTEKATAAKTHAYQAKGRKASGIIIAGFAATALLIFFIWVYWIKGRPVSKPYLETKDKIADVKPQGVTEAKKKEAPVVAETPDTARLHDDAVKEIKAKNYSSAESILRNALLIKPDDAVVHNHLGLSLKNQGRYKDAVIFYEKAMKLKPDYYEAMNNLAVTYEMLGNRDKAKSLYKKALYLKSSYAEAHLNYALLLEAEGNNSEAESHYHIFLNLSSDEALKNRVKERIRGLKK